MREKEVRGGRKKRSNRVPSPKVFPFLLNQAAFIHRAVFSVDGKLKPDFVNEVQDCKNQGIYTSTSLYSRRVSARSLLNGNQIEILYGRKSRFKNVPSFQITIHSDRIPLTSAQVKLEIKNLTSYFPQIRISTVEFTFDVTDTSINYVFRHLIHRARTNPRLLTDGQRKTIYVGSPRSAWQVRIYQKTSEVVRLEFVLRRAFLSRLQINQPEDLLLLRKLKVWDLLSIKRFSASTAKRLTDQWSDTVKKELVLTWSEYRRPLQTLPNLLKKCGVHPHRVLRRTCLQKKLEKMQRWFLW